MPVTVSEGEDPDTALMRVYPAEMGEGVRTTLGPVQITALIADLSNQLNRILRQKPAKR